MNDESLAEKSCKAFCILQLSSYGYRGILQAQIRCEGGYAMTIREADAEDAEALRVLYMEHLTQYPPEEEQDMNQWRGMLRRIEADDKYHLFVAEAEGRLVSSVTLIIIENLTHNLRPYAVMENVVTHADYRNRGYASALIQHGFEIAEKHGCYKVMLMTGSKKESTLDFYRNNGFDLDEKTGCIKRL
jgi:GNAT superfamily N-acetyltransferase